MPVDRLPGGTRGARTPPRRLLAVLLPIMKGFTGAAATVPGSDLLYLTTVGARTGERRTHPVARFDDGRGGWLVVASFGGAARHPGWYHNIAAHPSCRGVLEVRGVTHRVEVEQLEGLAYDAAWAHITERSPSFLDYVDKTDRRLPVLRLTPVAGHVYRTRRSVHLTYPTPRWLGSGPTGAPACAQPAGVYRGKARSPA